jgi:hypothetical protein
MPLQIGQGSGDFRETSGRVQLFHMGIRNTMGILTADAFTQTNPPVVAGSNTSTTLAGVTKKGVLGGTIAFTRPDVGGGNGRIGGPVKVSSAYVATIKPLGIFINDALGNAFENTPGVASGRGPYVHGMASVGVTLWETQNQIGNANDVAAYTAGQKLYASVNGLLTNNIADAYEYNVSGQTDPDFVTIIGIVKIAPDANNSLLVLDMRI